MKTYGGVKSIGSPLLTSVLDGGWWSASRLCCFTHEESAHGTHLISGNVGHSAGLNAAEKIKISCYCRESNLNFFAVQPIAIPTELSRLLQEYKFY
jgi:hypothetical protein